jgi:hypothetical protein
VPTSKIVTTPNKETEHALLVVPAPSEYSTVKPEDAVAPNAKLGDPNVLVVGCANVMF